ncbi:hypothetical protein [Treponema sp.]|uniref:hypothetical protein n=1 Tax=Treponema sp. TaxID=166 RepID=UPI003FA2AA6C
MLIGRILFALAAIFVILFFVFIIVAIVRLIKKKTVKIYFLLSIVSLLACIVSIYLGITLLEQAYQDDCDVVRLRHLSYYGNLIEEYKLKVGKYPFEGENQQVYAFIYNNEQKEYCDDTNPYSHIQKTPKEFFSQLEKGLGRQIDQLFDPQYVPSGRPVFYIYMIDGNQYFFAVHLSKKYPFSKKVASKYYKAEISNISDEEYQFYKIEELEKNEDFKKATNKNFGGYFELRKNQHIREYE